MTAPSLYAALASRGVRLSIAPTPKEGELHSPRLRVQAPEGALTPGLKAAIERHRADLVDFVFELEERAAIHLERPREDVSAAEWERAVTFVRSFVRGGGATPERALMEMAEHHPTVKFAAQVFGGLEVVSVRRAAA